MGALAESFGMSQGLKYRKAIKAELEEVLRLDAGYEAGSADRALGRWYFKVPGLFGGSNEKSEQHLRKSLTYDPQSTASWYFLAETLEDMGRKADARAALQHVIDAPLNPEWAPEDRQWKALAKTRSSRRARALTANSNDSGVASRANRLRSCASEFGVGERQRMSAAPSDVVTVKTRKFW